MTTPVRNGERLSTSIRHLKVFDSVAHPARCAPASDECHISQPAVTQAIAKLEEQLGVTLFERRASGSYLNPFGSSFICAPAGCSISSSRR